MSVLQMHHLITVIITDNKEILKWHFLKYSKFFLMVCDYLLGSKNFSVLKFRSQYYNF